MANLNERMRGVEEVPFQEDWDAIELRATSTKSTRDPAGRRAVRAFALLAATLLVLGAALYGLKDLGGGPQAAALRPGEIVRYQLGSPPQPISVGEGAAWVKIGSGTGTTNGLVRIDAATGQQQSLDTPGGDWTAVGGGSTWLLCNSAECSGGSVVRLDPATGEVLGMTRLPARGGQIAGTPEGAWISTEQGISFVDAEGTLTKSFAINQANLVGADGDTLWVSGAGGVRSIDPETGTVLATVDFQDACTMEAAAGTVWVASCKGQGDRLMGIDAATGWVLFDRPIEGYGQMRFADGVLWLAERDPSNLDQIRVLSFDPRAGSSLGEPLAIPSDPRSDNRFRMETFVPPHVFFAVGENSLWLTDFGAGDVIRVGIPSVSTSTAPAPATPAALVSESFAVGSQPSSLAAADGWVWVAEEPNSIDKVDPSTGRAVDSITLSGRAEWLEGGNGFLYVATYSQAHGSDIQVIDTTTDRAVGTFPGLRGPLVLAPDGLWAVSSDLVAETNDVVLVEPANGQILDRVRVPGSPIDMAAAGRGSVWVQPLVSGAGNNVAVRVSTTGTEAITPIDGSSAGIWLASSEDGVWLAASMVVRHSSSAFVAAAENQARPFGSIYNFRPMTVADDRVWFVAGPGDGPLQGVCGLRIDTQDVDVCADVSVADLEAAHQPVAFEATTNTLWVSAYNRPEISRISLSQG